MEERKRRRRRFSFQGHKNAYFPPIEQCMLPSFYISYFRLDPFCVLHSGPDCMHSSLSVFIAVALGDISQKLRFRFTFGFGTVTDDELGAWAIFRGKNRKAVGRCRVCAAAPIRFRVMSRSVTCASPNNAILAGPAPETTLKLLMPKAAR